MIRVLAICLVMSFIMSDCFAIRASTSGAQHQCMGQALVAFKTGQTALVDAYLAAGNIAYFTGKCEPILPTRIKIGRPEGRP